MGKFDKDFRPDKLGSGLFNRLYLTKKQRLSAAKWLLYSLVVLLMSVAQDVILCQVSLYGGTTDLVPCAIFVVCILEGSETGSLFCLIAALIYQFSGTAPGFHIIPLIPFLGVSVSIFRQNYLQKGFFSTFLCACAAVMVYELVIFGAALFVEQTHAGRFHTALITGGLDCLVLPLLYPVMVSISKIGGETWRE